MTFTLLFCQTFELPLLQILDIFSCTSDGFSTGIKFGLDDFAVIVTIDLRDDPPP